MTAPRCQPDGFRTLRQARNAAWLRASNTGKRVEPVHCDNCGRYHLAAPTNDQQGAS